MIDRDAFDRLVREALAGLRERSLLLGHPLVDLLGAGPADGEEGRRLSRILLEAINELRPPRHVSLDSHAWRAYRCLFLRYVEGVDLESIAAELGVGERQVRRDHQEGLKKLADSLWARHCRLHNREEVGSEQGSGSADDPSHEAALEAQLIKVGVATTDSPTDLGEVLEGVLATVGRLAEQSQVTLNNSVTRGLYRVTANRVALRQALLSVLSLAIDIASERHVCISARSQEQGVRVVVAVALRGRRALPGIDEDSRFRVSCRLVEMQGGALDARCHHEASGEDDRWTLTFEFGLQVAQLDAVLLIDDDPDVYRLFQRYLKASPYRLVHSLTSQRAIELAQKARPHAIILDVIMPARDGWEILQELRDHRATCVIPVIVCSVLEERGLAESLGAREFVLKPVTRQGLLAALDRCRTETIRAEHRDPPSDTRSTRAPEVRHTW